MKTFVRDRFTWLAYFMLGYFAYMESSLGPIVPFLRAELHLNYTLSGFHLSAFAIGIMLAGLTADRLARRWGRYIVFWGGGLGMAVGAVLLAIGGHVIVTIGSSFIMGFLGSLLLIMIQATLSEHHGEQRAVALTESNIVASILATFAPVLVGFGVSFGLGWQVALYAAAISWVLMALLLWRVALPDAPRSPGNPVPVSHEPLPRVYWSYWIVVFLAAAIEFCIVFWAADFLEKVAGLSRETAATALSIFLLAVVIGRAAGSRLARTVDIGKLLLIAAFVVLGGFPIFWLARTPVLNVVGLFICGLGVANLFPLTLAAASGVALPGQSNTASARISLGAGTAILVVPQLLGSAADQIGIQNAYGIVIMLTLLAIVFASVANRMAARQRLVVEPAA